MPVYRIRVRYTRNVNFKNSKYLVSTVSKGGFKMKKSLFLGMFFTVLLALTACSQKGELLNSDMNNTKKMMENKETFFIWLDNSTSREQGILKEVLKEQKVNAYFHNYGKLLNRGLYKENEAFVKKYLITNTDTARTLLYIQKGKLKDALYTYKYPQSMIKPALTKFIQKYK
jgi:hypothetical protein